MFGFGLTEPECEVLTKLLSDSSTHSLKSASSTMAEETSTSGTAGAPMEVHDHLPLDLIRSQQVPPAPNRRPSSFDYLDDFAGFPWIAYGASSLLVISHFPSPSSSSSSAASDVGPFFRQVIDPPGPSHATAEDVNSVSWCPARPSDGLIAAASGNTVRVYLPDHGDSSGILCWRQIAGLVQSSFVEAIGWTGSGDGLVLTGIDIVSWKRRDDSWEMVWKSIADQPQSLISATWSVEGFVATGCHPSISSKEAVKRVSVYYGNAKVELCHPQFVSGIQWRPVNALDLEKCVSRPPRDVLLTCCLDGAARMWSEVDDGKAKKSGKRSFHVVAVIEVDRFLDGRLGIDTSVMWAIDVGAVISKCEGDKYSLMRDDSEDDWVGMCQWLVGVGPKNSLAFWSVHCLDDISPLRFPRVNLWKKLNLLDFSSESQCSIDHLSLESSPIAIKTIISRTRHFGPPKLCNLVQLRPDNSISCLELSDAALSKDVNPYQEGRERHLSCLSGSVLSQDGHTGTILQVAISPCSCDISLCASLDCYGWLLLWSHSSISNCILGAHRIGFPTWKLIGKVLTEDICTSARYSSLCWAPSRLGDSHVLLLGHEQGIDFLLIKLPRGEGEEILCQKVGMISFGGHVHEEGPDKISVTPLPSICGKSFISNCFMLLGIWMKGFSAVSWKVELHSTDLSGEGCGCSFADGNNLTSPSWKDETPFDGRKYYVSAVLCSSKIPEPHYHNLVTSFATVCPAGLMPSVHQLLASQVWQSHSSSYHMATGYCDGTVKLWRINTSESLTQQSKGQPQAWELVGMFMVHRGPVNGIALSSCGSKIASVSVGTSEGSSCLYIWEPTCLVNTGNFFIEECLFLDGVVIAMNWLSIGNGQLLLGVCMANELRIYSQKRYPGQVLEKSGTSIGMQEWVCISQCCTSHMARNFLWGPGATLLLVHQRHFSNFGQWSFNIDKKNQAKLHLKYSEDHTNSHLTEDGEKFPFSFFAETGASGVKECLVNENGETFKLTQPATNATVNGKATNSCLMTYQEKYGFGTKNEFHSMLEIAYELRRPLPIYHPRALLLFMNTGNWKCAYAALQHLGGYLNSDQTSNMSRKDNGSIFPEFYLSKHYEENFSSSDHNEGLQWGGSLQKSGVQIYGSSLQLGEGNSAANASENIFSSIPQKSEFGGIISSLEKKTNCIRDITEVEKMQIFAIVDLLGEVSDPLQASPYGSFDEPGRRFWVAVRFQHLQFFREFGRVASVEELVVDSKAVAWAFQSDCQDNLFVSVLPNDPSWLEMRNMGVGFWFTNITLLRARMEKLARLQYLKKKDPKDCALLYLALNRLQVLVGLFKISRNEKDRPLVGFLSRNFQEEKNKAAALKNAYVLLGKHQLELAIAFFLLGGDPSSAITVCAKNLGDPQLAIVICRLLEGYGGKLERHLISSYLLPNAIEKTDYWLSSLLEWTLGNYTQSFKVMLSSTMDPTADEPDILHNHLAFSESDIGQYCTLLANRNSLRSSVGEHMAASLLKCGLWMTLSALNKCGLPLEAMDCVSNFLGTIEGKERADYSNFKKHDPTLPCSPSEGNWMLADVAFPLELHVKLSLAMQCLSRLMMEHPSWPATNIAPFTASVFSSKGISQDDIPIENLKHKFATGLSIFKQKYFLNTADLIHMITLFSSNSGSSLLGYEYLLSYFHQELHDDTQLSSDNLILYPAIDNLILEDSKELSQLLAQYVVACSITHSSLHPTSDQQNVIGSSNDALDSHMLFLCSIRSLLRRVGPLLGANISRYITNDLKLKDTYILDIFEYCTCFASTWFQRNLKGLVLMIKPILYHLRNKHSHLEVLVLNLEKAIGQAADVMVRGASIGDGENLPAADFEQMNLQPSGLLNLPPCRDEMWHLLGACLWGQLYNFFQCELSLLFNERHKDGKSTDEQISLFPVLFSKLKINLTFIYSSLTKNLASFLRQKLEKGSLSPTLVWLEESDHSSHGDLPNTENQGDDFLENFDNGSEEHLCKLLWQASVSSTSKDICECFVQEKVIRFHSKQKISTSWTGAYKSIMLESETVGTICSDHESRVSSRSHIQRSVSNGFPGSRRKDLGGGKEVIYFHNPREVYKRNGELLEAMCFNSIDHQEVALASNRKGILFFNWKRSEPSRELDDYIWSESDWPRDGWAGSESTPIPTFVSPGVGLGSKKGAHLGLGGATFGLGSLARPGKDLTGGGAFGIPGYAGMGASGLGWGEQEDFEEFVDPPATVENISTRSLSSHPLRPFFLVGSSNTHVYLWEFGKYRATATYGVLPAANVPPPYALASISALQFDHCGHRFASAALDGTVCTWQLEVGGRSNVCPTESSLCFNSHASDVSYLAASGSVLAVAGCSSNGVNVVIWDVLAPPATSQASLVCHEGGARSLSVFDNEVGSGSISPLIVTGGKAGDVGLHDFRFIATGRMKRQKHPSDPSTNTHSSSPNRIGENPTGMLWYIPKAHQGSITRITTIPNTSLFLTGGKDGDVKLWDAKKSELVYHWPKLHDRHTFLQPNSRGFGGIVRAAVTDIKALPHGFLSCGGDGAVRHVQLQDFTNRSSS